MLKVLYIAFLLFVVGVASAFVPIPALVSGILCRGKAGTIQTKPNSTQEERLKIIDHALASYGQVHIELLTDFFDISEDIAKRDLQIYRLMAPLNLISNQEDDLLLKSPLYCSLY